MIKADNISISIPHHMIEIIIICMLMALSLFNCSAKRNFIIESEPKKALIMLHQNANIDSSEVTIAGETPAVKTLSFPGHAIIYVSVEKRGYKQETTRLTRESDTLVRFKLERIKSIAENSLNKARYNTGKFAILPINIAFITHSGVGNFDEKKLSIEKSTFVSQVFQRRAMTILNEIQPKRQWHTIASENWESWHTECNQMAAFFYGLDSTRLQFYSHPPCIPDSLKLFANLMTSIEQQSDFLLYIDGFTISETTGRKISNFFLSGIAPVAKAANPSLVYDPSAFYPNDGTTLRVIVIDASTLEVVYISKKHLSYDLEKTEQIDSAIRQLLEF